MKNLFSIIIFSCLTLAACSPKSSVTSNDGPETITMHVSGVCGMCKERIETTTYNQPGVKQATWDAETGMLTAVIVPGKTDKVKISEALAKVGHATELAKADPGAYSNLPACCKYDDGVEKH